MGGHAVGMNLRIAQYRFHGIHLDAYVTYHRNLRGVLRDLEIVLQFHIVGDGVDNRHLRSEQPEILLCICLTVIAPADTQSAHIAQLTEIAFQLREEIEVGRMHIVDGMHITLINVMTVSLG